MSRDINGNIIAVDRGEVFAAVVEAIEFDANTSPEAGGSGVWFDSPDRVSPIEEVTDGPTPDAQGMILRAVDGTLWQLTIQQVD